jgi:hypothetical protein
VAVAPGDGGLYRVGNRILYDVHIDVIISCPMHLGEMNLSGFIAVHHTSSNLLDYYLSAKLAQNAKRSKIY